MGMVLRWFFFKSKNNDLYHEIFSKTSLKVKEKKFNAKIIPKIMDK